MKKKIIILITVIILLALAGLFLAKNKFCFTKINQKSAWTDQMQLEYANTLLAKGLAEDAAQAFAVYIDKARVDKKELAGVCNKLGNIYMDLKQYEKALGCYYRSEMLNPGADYKQEMNQKIVAALENLGLSEQARYELESRTSIKPVGPKNPQVAVRIGKREISNEEIEALMNRLPEQVKKSLSEPDAKLRFVKEYVASEVLYDKAKMLGLDKTPENRAAVEDFKKQLVLQQLISDEVRKELKITPEDLMLYYKANKDRYSTPERAKVSYLELSNASKSDEMSAALKQGRGKKITQWIQAGSVFLSEELGESKEAVEGILKQNKGGIAGPVKIKDKLYMFIVDEKEPRKEPTFEEVRQQVANEYRMQKEQQIVRNMLDKALEQQEIEILYQPKPKAENENSSK